MEQNTVKLLIHSNGYPCHHKSLLTNGIQLATDWMGDWSLCLAWGDLDARDALNKIGAANYSKIKRALSGVETAVEKARKSCDKALYASAIGMLIRRKKFVQNYVR